MHSFRHYYRLALLTSKMIVDNSRFDRLAKTGKIGVKFCECILKKRSLQNDNGIFAFYNVAGIAHDVI